MKTLLTAIIMMVTLNQCALAHAPRPVPPPHHGGAPAPSAPPAAAPSAVGSLRTNDKIVFAGDSVTWAGSVSYGWLTLFQQYVQTMYPTLNLTCINAGIKGETSQQVLANTKSFLKVYRPNVYVIWIGINDINSTGGRPNYSHYIRNVIYMIKEAQASGVREVVLVTPFLNGEYWTRYSNPYDPQIATIQQLLFAIGSAYRVPVIDVRSIAMHAESMYNPGDLSVGVLTDDRLHPNVLGSQVIEGAFLTGFGL